MVEIEMQNPFSSIFINDVYSQYYFRNLCDTRGLGKLNTEQFALAMYLIQQKLKGIEPPQTLPPDMMPPSMRQSVSNIYLDFDNQKHFVEQNLCSSAFLLVFTNVYND